MATSVIAFGAAACGGDDDDDDDTGGTVPVATATGGQSTEPAGSATSSSSPTTAASATSGSGSTSPTASTGGGGDTTELEISADKLKFDKDELEATAGSKVELKFENKEAVPHNLSIYEDESAKEEIFKGDLVTNETVTYEFDAPDEPGEYYFHCDVHPNEMKGTFIVQ